ncbi:MAG: hypothetical protein LBV41_10255 [Cytophagaceae bacterium]|jgi:hypothetical protein|nr:hypothetical protein [Cytophagaceae bacterium]
MKNIDNKPIVGTNYYKAKAHNATGVSLLSNATFSRYSRRLHYPIHITFIKIIFYFPFFLYLWAVNF